MDQTIADLELQLDNVGKGISSLSMALEGMTVDYTKLDPSLVEDIPEIILAAARGEPVDMKELCDVYEQQMDKMLASMK